MHGLQNMFYFERGKHSCRIFTQFSVTYCHKVLRLRCCRGHKTSWPCANMNCMCRKSYSSAWPKITTGHCEFNAWLLYLFFKFWYQATKTQSIGDVVHELTTKEWLSSVKKWDIRLNVVLFISNALRHL